MVARGLLSWGRATAHKAGALPPLQGTPGAGAHARGDRRPAKLHRHAHGRGRPPRPDQRGRGGDRDPARRDPPLEPGARPHDAGGRQMSREIVEAIRGLEQEKGIDAETLMGALEDALLSAYKKT